jgi:hypothetical protein
MPSVVIYMLIPVLVIGGIFMITKAPAIKAFYDKDIFGPRFELLAEATVLASIRVSGIGCIVMALMLLIGMWVK